MIRALIALPLAALPLAAAPGAPSLSLPIRCEIGRTCWIQKYADLADGPERRDYRCGMITTDGHDGVDFRLASLAALRAGVPVLAAAPGTVLRIRDGEPDAAMGAVSIGGGKEAGNGVVIDHGDGWETQYSHLMRGSIRVRPGDRVAAGAPVGSVGLSGNTEYPHLHFSVRRAASKIDPFTGLALPGQCADRGARPLWSAAALPALAYPSGQIVRVAFANAPQNRATLQAGDPRPPGRSDPMLLMAELIDVKAGDVQRFELRGPGGQLLLAQDNRLERGNLTWVGFAGTTAPAPAWPIGRYTGSFSLIRPGSPKRRVTVTLEMR